MKILYIYRYLLLGGVTTQLANRLAYLKKVCDPHFIFLSNHGGSTAFDGYEKLFVNSDPAAIFQYIEEQKFDVIIAIDVEEVTDYLKRVECKTPVIQEVHGISYKLKYLKEQDTKQFQAYIVPSAYSKNRIIKDYDAPEEKTHVIPNCLDSELFYPKQTDLLTNKKIICWVGKLNDHKNWMDFLELAEKISKERNDCVFWVIGGETASEKASRNFYKELTNRSIRVNWIDRMEYEQMPYLYSMVAQSGGCTVSTSKGESFGMSLIEAMACGCPAVAPTVGAIPELYTGSLKNLTYELHDLDSCSLIIHNLLDNPEIRGEHIKNGRVKVQENYSIQRVVSQYYNLLHELV